MLFENPWLVAFCVIAGASGLMCFLMVFLLGRQKMKEFGAGYMGCCGYLGQWALLK